MAEKKFMLEENQFVWESYYSNIMETFMEENNAEIGNEAYSKKKISLLQYKPVAIAFEAYVGKSFDYITAEDIKAFAEYTDKKSKLAHLNAFLLASVTNGYIVNDDTDFLISLLPKEYKKLGKMIAENRQLYAMIA